LDITRICNYGSASTIRVWVLKNGEWAGAACANHPTMDVSYTVKCWKRTILGSDVKRGLNKKTITATTWQQLHKKYTMWGK
jgi:hypothetical protein